MFFSRPYDSKIIESLFGFHSPQLAAFFSAAGHSFAKLFSKASKNTPLLAAG